MLTMTVHSIKMEEGVCLYVLQISSEKTALEFQ